jgi:hypothetical protein
MGSAGKILHLNHQNHQPVCCAPNGFMNEMGNFIGLCSSHPQTQTARQRWNSLVMPVEALEQKAKLYRKRASC